MTVEDARRFVCIHGHFYQPPRENPWLGAVEPQESAYPYHDWNERITAECYAANTASRILDGDGRIVRITNNYSRISFNVGPTLLAWLEQREPEVYEAILAADRASQHRFSGHGSAMAQAYNHMILPLATQRDRQTQIIWGIRDFARRFGRRPEGLWLPETAVDLATLDLLAELGISFTILAPHQARRVRHRDGGDWREVSGGHVDPSMPYEVALPSGRRIAVFFYDGPISQAVAFERLLVRGEALADRLVGAFGPDLSRPRLVHIATDGETYGHHHRRGDMALAYALDYMEAGGLARLTNYGEFLEICPPSHEVEIIEDSSWSCVHGIERWRSDCGCRADMGSGWTQGWRRPLREALDFLRDELAERFERVGGRIFRDPWGARDDYISVILDRSPANVDQFLAQHCSVRLSQAARIRALKLLEMQRFALLMYTSCGWFFDEPSGLETVQVLRYAARALQLGEEIADGAIEPAFLDRLDAVVSNIPSAGTGRQIYQDRVRPAMVDLQQVGAHYAVSSLFENYGDRTTIYDYTVEREDYRRLPAGRSQMALGRIVVRSNAVGESERLSFGVLHLGDHNLSGGVRRYRGQTAYDDFVAEASEAFATASLSEVIRIFDRTFESSTYSLSLLFGDERQKVLNQVLDSSLAEAETAYRQVYEHHAPLLRFLASSNAAAPGGLSQAAEFALNTSLRRALEADELDPARVRSLLAEAASIKVKLDHVGLAFALARTIDRIARAFSADPTDLDLLGRLESATLLAHSLPFEVDLWRSQNAFYLHMHQTYPEMLRRARAGDSTAQAWTERFALLGTALRVRLTTVTGDADERRVRPPDRETMRAVAEAASAAVAQARVPRALYRLQLSPRFTFEDAAELVAYLDELGISDCHASPLLRARRGSTHGYDVSDHAHLNPDLGTPETFDAWSTALHARGMGLILDIVPNHMGIGDASNRWWMDVLENGPSSAHARYFDIDWHPVTAELQNRLLLPILEDQYGVVLESGKLRLIYADGAFFIQHYEARLPLAPRTYRRVLSEGLGGLIDRLGAGHEYVLEYESILAQIDHLPLRSEISPERIAERDREKEVIQRRIAALYATSVEVRDEVDAAVAHFNGTVGVPSSFDPLDALLDAQVYRPAFWRVAAEEINYRRFFDINDMAAIRVEIAEVFRASHALALRLLAEGAVDGFRIDHPDGLWDPETYFQRLQIAYLVEKVRAALGPAHDERVIAGAVASWLRQRAAEHGGAAASPLFVAAEKILSGDEPLPSSWLVAGTTGYDFLNDVNGLFVDPRQRRAFDRIYSGFSGREIDFPNLVNSTKKMIMLVSMASELNSLSRQLERLTERTRRYRDFTLNSLTFALREVIACLPVYRTYVTSRTETVAPLEQRYVAQAIAEAKRRNPRTASLIFDFVENTLLLRNAGDFDEEGRRRLVDFVMRFQQVTGPVMAKGAEDTAFYVYNRLLSLNEVGGHPDEFGVAPAAFHRAVVDRQRRWPHAVLTTSTHDTKRSEDVRARIDVLSEMPDTWRTALQRWARLNAAKKTLVDGVAAPDRNDEYLLYQTLLGAWPSEPLTAETLAVFRDRLVAYMEKATREAKTHTTWVNPNEAYDAAVRDFVVRLLPDTPDDPFLTDFQILRQRVAYFGELNALSQVLLKLTLPGVPELYQGCEMWDLSLVDPDNRRPVDFARRRAALAELREQIDVAGGDLGDLAARLLAAPDDGCVKLYLTYQALALRRRRPDLFAHGSYQPLEAVGAKASHVVAAVRRHEDASVAVVVPRLVVELADGVERAPLGADVWRDTRLIFPEADAGAHFRDVLTGQRHTLEGRDGPPGLAMASLLARFPLALLERVD